MTGDRPSSTYVVADPLLGWRGRPRFAGFVPEYPNVPVQLDGDGWRVLPAPAQPFERQVFLYGCSYVFGVGVPGEATFAAKLQRALPGSRIAAYGLPGFGTVQSFLRLQRDLRAATQPAIAVFCLLDVHLRRNVASSDYVFNLQGRYWSRLSPRASLPRAGLEPNGQLFIRPLRLGHPGLCAEDARDFATDGRYAAEVTRRLIGEAAREASRPDSSLVLAVLRADRAPAAVDRLVADCRSDGISCHDLSFPRGGSLDLSPTDFHPNLAGHDRYCEGLLRLLAPLVGSGAH